MPVNFYYDELTGLYNRKYLREYAEQEIKRAKRYRSSFSILILDLDNFKEINDTMGHLTGDSALKRFAGVVKEIIRESDIAARYGGDEFVLILPDTSYRGAYRLAERLIERVKEEKINGMPLGCSIGIATFPDDGLLWEELFEKADESLYAAKRLGKGRIGTKTSRITSLKIPLPMLIDRREERGIILTMLKQAGKLHLITGEAGIGKTRLLNFIIKEKDDILLLKTSALGAIANIPFYAIRELLKGFYLSRQEIFEIIMEDLPPVLKNEFLKIVPYYSSKSETNITWHGFDKYTLYESIFRFFNMLSLKHNPVIFIDDFHWIDSESAELLYYLLRVATDLVFFATARDRELTNTKAEEIITLLGRERLYDTLHLKPFSRTSTKNMLTAILGQDVSDELVDIVFEESGGNPFFIEEITRTLYKENKLILSKKVWSLQGNEFNIPKTIEDTVKQRIKRLNAEDLNILNYLALSGKEIDPEFIAFTLKMNEGEVYDILDKLSKELILVNINDRFYQFKEGIIKEIIVKNISKGKLSIMHRTIGNAIEKFYNTRIEHYIEELAYHFREGKERHKDKLYAKKAGDKAMQMYAYEKAAQYYLWAYEAASNPQEKSELAFMIGEAYTSASEFEMALKYYLIAHNEASYRTKSDIAQKIGDAYMYLGRSKDAIDWYRKAQDEAYPEYKKYIYALDIAWEYHQNGETTKALKIVEASLPHIPEHEKTAIGTAHNILGAIYMNLGQYEKAEKHFLKSIEYREQTGDRKALVGSHNNLGILYDNMLRYDEVIKHYNIALLIYREIGYREGEAIMTYNMGLLYHAIGEFDKALKHLKESAEIFELIRSQYSLTLVYTNLAMLYEILGRYHEVMPALKNSQRIAREINHEYTIFDTTLSMFNFLGSRKKYEEARRLLPTLMKYEETYRDEPSLIYLYDSISRFYEETGELRKAYEYAIKSHEVTQKLTRDKNDRSYCINYLEFARLLGKTGQIEEAKKYIKLAEEHPYNEKVKMLPEIRQAYFMKEKRRGISCNRIKTKSL